MQPLEVLSGYGPHSGTLQSILESRAALRGDHTFLYFEGEETTWAGFCEVVERMAAVLDEAGVRPGDRVAMMAQNSDRYVTLFFAIARLGAILVPVNPDFGVEEAGYILGHAEVSTLLVEPTRIETARGAARRAGVRPWIATWGPTDGEADDFADLVQRTSRTEAPGEARPEDACLILYTSGTTGFPKGAMHTQRSFTLAGEGFVERMHLVPDDRLLCVLPMFHINALFYSLGGAVAAGASLALAPRFSASRFWHLAAESGATEVNIIAAVGNILARRPRTEYDPRHRIRKLYGAPITQEIYDVFREEFDVPILIEGYGMTEIPGACNQPFGVPPRIGTMGRAARHPDPEVRFAELRVVDEEGRDLPPGEVGELFVRTPIVMAGYYRDPEQTRAAFHDGWFATGDLVRCDTDGYFTFVARKKDIIRKRGENISGAELDRVIGEHPGVAMAAALAVPSDLGEDEILVAVVRGPDSRVSAQEIAAWCLERLAPIKQPRYVRFLDSLPLTPTHRVAKFRLKEDPDLLDGAVDLGA